MALRSLVCGLRQQRERCLRLAAPQLTAARFYASGGEQKVHLVFVPLWHCWGMRVATRNAPRAPETRPSNWPHV